LRIQTGSSHGQAGSRSGRTREHVEVLVGLSKTGEASSGLMKAARDLGFDFALDIHPSLFPPERAFWRIRRLCGKKSVYQQGQGRASGGKQACSFTQRKCRPTASAGKSRASRDGLLNPLPVAVPVGRALVTIPCCETRAQFPRLTPGVSPQSSAFYNQPFKTRKHGALRSPPIFIGRHRA